MKLLKEQKNHKDEALLKASDALGRTAGDSGGHHSPRPRRNDALLIALVVALLCHAGVVFWAFPMLGVEGTASEEVSQTTIEARLSFAARSGEEEQDRTAPPLTHSSDTMDLTVKHAGEGVVSAPSVREVSVRNTDRVRSIRSPSVKKKHAEVSPESPTSEMRVDGEHVGGTGGKVAEDLKRGDGQNDASPPTRVSLQPLDTKELFDAYIRTVGRDVRRDFQYPRRLVRARVEGTVLLDILVDREGEIREYGIATSSGDERLDKAALDAIKRIRRVSAPPARLNWSLRTLQVPFVYRLKG